MHCTNCGKSLALDAIFCNSCGTKVHIKTNSAAKSHHHQTNLNEERIETSEPVLRPAVHPSQTIMTILAALGIGFVYILLRRVFIYVLVLVVLGILFFIFNLIHPNPVNESATQLQTLSCKDFLALSSSDRMEVGNKLYAAKYNQVNAMAGASTMMNLEYSCNNQLPNITLGQLNY